MHRTYTTHGSLCLFLDSTYLFQFGNAVARSSSIHDKGKGEQEGQQGLHMERKLARVGSRVLRLLPMVVL